MEAETVANCWETQLLSPGFPGAKHGAWDRPPLASSIH